jgi:hypothetical protein
MKNHINPSNKTSEQSIVGREKPQKRWDSFARAAAGYVPSTSMPPDMLSDETVITC